MYNILTPIRQSASLRFHSLASSEIPLGTNVPKEDLQLRLDQIHSCGST